VAVGVSEIDELIHRGDLDGLVRLVDSHCATADWAALLELRNRSRAAVNTGRQLWPAATLAEYRLALWAPAEWAALVLDEESGRFTIGPLTEVVSQQHRFDDLNGQLADGPRLGFIAHECALRGQQIPVGIGNPLDIPFGLQSWEPDYCLAEYSDDGVDAPAPSLPDSSQFVVMADSGGAELIEDPDVAIAVRRLVEQWTTSSNGRAEIVGVEGTADAAVTALGANSGRLAPIEPSQAMAWLAWAGASGGAHGRRRGAAIGRFGAWWTVVALAALGDVWPVGPADIGDA
jgi:resuscitation-promoting factor RpfA